MSVLVDALSVDEVEGDKVCLVGHQQRYVTNPEQCLQQGQVHVPVVPIVDQSSVGVLDHGKPKSLLFLSNDVRTSGVT